MSLIQALEERRACQREQQAQAEQLRRARLLENARAERQVRHCIRRKAGVSAALPRTPVALPGAEDPSLDHLTCQSTSQDCCARCKQCERVLQVARRRAAQRRAAEEAAEARLRGRLPASARCIDFRFTRIHETGQTRAPLAEVAPADNLLLALDAPPPSPGEAGRQAEQCAIFHPVTLFVACVSSPEPLTMGLGAPCPGCKGRCLERFMSALTALACSTKACMHAGGLQRPRVTRRLQNGGASRR